MVIDERLLIAGSLNYTGPAGTLNDENILILGELGETNPAAETAQQQTSHLRVDRDPAHHYRRMPTSLTRAGTADLVHAARPLRRPPGSMRLPG
jgi:phosphatidylserine/phosphatidylglycerophosphate/cardiolipin synthase-like enzyme